MIINQENRRRSKIGMFIDIMLFVLIVFLGYVSVVIFLCL